MMSRWSWHEKHGVVKGPIKRVSDTLKSSEREHEIADQHKRELDWIYNHSDEVIYREYRTCCLCGARSPQAVMRWTGKQWLCHAHYMSFISTSA
jgi:hypothetical protein